LRLAVSAAERAVTTGSVIFSFIVLRGGGSFCWWSRSRDERSRGGFGRCFFDRLGVQLGGLHQLLVDFLHEGGNADASLDAVVEFEEKVRAVFKDDAFGDACGEDAALGIEFVHDGLLLGRRPDDTDEDVGVFEVGGEVDIGNGDEHVREAVVAGQDAGQLALDQLGDSGFAVGHGREVFSFQLFSFQKN